MTESKQTAEYTGLTTTKCAFWVQCYGGLFYQYEIILKFFGIYFEVILWIDKDFEWNIKIYSQNGLLCL